MTMSDFMDTIAPDLWPKGNRIAFCYMERQSLTSNTENSCNAKEGNPFGPFWDEFSIDFDASEFYAPLNYDVHHNTNMADRWNVRYPADKWPVLAFTGAPAVFPVQAENRDLHKYLKWSDRVQSAAAKFIKDVLPKGAFIGVHLRNGIDWIRACEHIKTSRNLFAAAQCLGYRNENGNATMDMCIPGRDVIVRQLKRHIKKANEAGHGKEIRSIFVASDSNHMIGELNEALQRMKVRAFRLESGSSHVDLAILGMSNHFIGNCVSSFSAFVKRERDARGFPSSFWAFPTEKGTTAARLKTHTHEEL